MISNVARPLTAATRPDICANRQMPTTPTSTTQASDMPEARADHGVGHEVADVDEAADRGEDAERDGEVRFIAVTPACGQVVEVGGGLLRARSSACATLGRTGIARERLARVPDRGVGVAERLRDGLELRRRTPVSRLERRCLVEADDMRTPASSTMVSAKALVTSPSSDDVRASVAVPTADCASRMPIDMSWGLPGAAGQEKASVAATSHHHSHAHRHPSDQRESAPPTSHTHWSARLKPGFRPRPSQGYVGRDMTNDGS